MKDVRDMIKHEIKCVVLGDAAVGKTCMLISYTTNKFPGDYLPTVFDNYTTKINVNGEVVRLNLWDTAGSEHFDMLRPLSYNGADIFMICYAINDRQSFENIKDKWVPDLKSKMNPVVPYMIIGTKGDLREMDDQRDKLISPKAGEDLAKEVGAKAYVEVSSITQKGLRECFNQAITIALLDNDDKGEKQQSSGCCIIL